MRKTQFCLPQRIVLPLPCLLLSHRVSAEVPPRLTDADLWALQLPSSSVSRFLLFPPKTAVVPAHCVLLSKEKKRSTVRGRTLGTFHSFHVIRVCPSKSRFHFL